MWNMGVAMCDMVGEAEAIGDVVRVTIDMVDVPMDQRPREGVGEPRQDPGVEGPGVQEGVEVHLRHNGFHHTQLFFHIRSLIIQRKHTNLVGYLLIQVLWQLGHVDDME